MGRYMCKVCDDKVLRKVIDEEAGRGLNSVTISRLMTARGFPVSADMIRVHRKHSATANIPPGVATGKDLAVLVRDKTVEAIENETLKITDPNWRNIGPGMSAQGLIDKRANKTDDRKTAIALAMILSGATGGGAPERLLIEDGQTIEGSFEEVDDEEDG